MDSRLFSEASSLADAGARAAKVSKGVTASSNGEKTKRSNDMQYNECGGLRLEPSQATALIQDPDAATRKPIPARCSNDGLRLFFVRLAGELSQHLGTSLGFRGPAGIGVVGQRAAPGLTQVPRSWGLPPPAPSLQVDQQPENREGRHQHDLIKAGIWYQDVGKQMGKVGDRIDDAEPEVDPPPGSPARLGTRRSGGIGDEHDCDQRQQEVAEHRPEQQGQSPLRHLAVDFRRLAVEQGHQAQVHVEQHRQQPGDPEGDQPQDMVDRCVHYLTGSAKGDGPELHARLQIGGPIHSRSLAFPIRC